MTTDYEYLRSQVIAWLQTNTLTCDGVYWYGFEEAVTLAADSLLKLPALRAHLIQVGTVQS